VVRRGFVCSGDCSGGRFGGGLLDVVVLFGFELVLVVLSYCVRKS
jgi:hypothetical protein